MTTTLDMMSSMEQTIAALTAENARLLNEVKAWKATADARTARVIALESEQRDYEQTCVRLNGENARLRGKVEEAVLDVRSCNALSEARREELVKCGAKNKGLIADLARVTAERDTYRDTVARLTAERDGLRERIDAVREQMPRGESCFACRGALSVLAACAPPASGEEG